MVRRPPQDFRDHFRRVIEHVIGKTRNSLRYFRTCHDFDEFMAQDAAACAGPRHLAMAFMARYFTIYLYPGLAQALYLGVVQYLAERSSRVRIDENDVRALKELGEIEFKTDEELGHWLDAHYRSLR